MINKIIEICAKNRLIVFVLIGMLTFIGLWSMKNISVDAIPDLSDTQVIIYSRWDRSPDIMEDQVTYPIIAKTLIILLAVPFSAVGAIWFLYFLGYNMSIAVWVGLIALLGVDAETGMFMLLYLDLSFHERQAKGQMRNWNDLKEAILHGAVKRLRPKVMTVAVMFMGLVPIMWSNGAART